MSETRAYFHNIRDTVTLLSTVDDSEDFKVLCRSVLVAVLCLLRFTVFRV